MSAVATFFAFFILIGLLTLAIVVPVTAPDTVPLPHVSVFIQPESKYAQQTAGCKTDWELATDERNISNTYFKQTYIDDEESGLNVLAAVWGQFIAHDVLRGVVNETEQVYQLGPLTLRRDTFRFVNNTQCREEELNNTPFIDGSTVYGDYWNAIDLRTNNGDGCRLKTSQGDLLPVIDARSFLAGDERNTENPVLNGLHVMFVRRHNHLCGLLAVDKPQWTEEQRYWKAREIVVATIQHITYNEWLPALLGSQRDLLTNTPEVGTGGRVTSEFSLAAFRLGHSLIPDNIGSYTLLELFFNSTLIQVNGIEPFVNAAIETNAHAVDLQVVDNLRNLLFGIEDIVVRNLFRARELTLNTYSEICNTYGTVATTAHEDAILGMFGEPVVIGSPLPKTIAVILAEQFKRLREHDPNHYTKIRHNIGDKYYKEIIHSNMATIIKHNTGLNRVKNKAFYV